MLLLLTILELNRLTILLPISILEFLRPIGMLVIHGTHGIRGRLQSTGRVLFQQLWNQKYTTDLWRNQIALHRFETIFRLRIWSWKTNRGRVRNGCPLLPSHTSRILSKLSLQGWRWRQCCWIVPNQQWFESETDLLPLHFLPQSEVGLSLHQFIAYFEVTMGDLIPKLLHFNWSTTASKALSRWCMRNW